MAYQIGQHSRTVGTYEPRALELAFGYRKTSHPRLLDLEVEAGTFQDKYAEWSAAKQKLVGELLEHDATPSVEELDDDGRVEALLACLGEEESEAWFERWLEVRLGLTSEDVEPVLEFVEEHITTVEGVTDSAGEPVTDWGDIPRPDREHLLGALPPWELAELYGCIKATVSLDPAKKNG